ncbi:MAG: IS110 family transposase, partial [Bacteroidales bacterium]|nr:IS110 family transposase [Bacteroidales bacterium]
SLLHLGAMTAIRGKNDLREYYLRKVAEGKNKMSALNAVRNKIIHRVFAVIKNQKFYENNLVVS